MAIFGTSIWPKLISRKIWVAEKSWNFHIVCSQLGCSGLYHFRFGILWNVPFSSNLVSSFWRGNWNVWKKFTFTLSMVFSQESHFQVGWSKIPEEHWEHFWALFLVVESSQVSQIQSKSLFWKNTKQNISKFW